MTLKQTGAFFAGLTITGIIYFLSFIFVGLSFFSLAGDTLESKEERDGVCFFYCLFLLVIVIFLVYKFLKSGFKFVSIGVAAASVILLYALVQLGIAYGKDLFYHTAFNKEKWAKEKPFNMAKTLLKGNSLIGSSKKAVIEKLGVDTALLFHDLDASLDYRTDNGWLFRISFKNNVVTEVDLYEEGFVISPAKEIFMPENEYPTFGNGKICYIELPSSNIPESASFYSKVFNWRVRTNGEGAA